MASQTMSAVTPDERLRAVARTFPSRKRRGALVALERLRRAVSIEGPARAIAIVGTNGKTSTATYIARLLREAGLSTGITVSPHLRSWSERVVVRGTAVPERVLADEVEWLDRAVG